MVRKLSVCLAVTSMLGLGACTTPLPAPHDDDAVLIGSKDPGRYCLRETGTHLRLAADQCAGMGRSYSRAEVLGTGAADVGGVVRRLQLR